MNEIIKTLKRVQVLQLIGELERWKKNRDYRSSQRTYGKKLTSEPLEKSIEYLKEYLELLTPKQ